MKKKLLFGLFAIFPLLLTSCSFDFLNNLSFPTSDSQGNGDESDLRTSFVNDKGQTVYFATNVDSLTLLPGMKGQILVDLYKDGEEPDFAGKWSGVKYQSLDTKVASVDEDGVVTALNYGETKIRTTIFTDVGAYIPVTVIQKELKSIEITNARKTYLLDSTFTPKFDLIATFKGGFEEIVEPTSVDYSAVNMHALGDYQVNVSYTFEDKTLNTSYTVSVIESASYEAKYLSYTMNDLDNNRSYAQFNGWYCPNKGNVKMLVIPVWFTDSTRFIEEARQDELHSAIQTAFFGDSLSNGWESVKTFYEKESLGALNITGVVSDYYYPSYATTAITNGTKTVNEVCIEAINFYFNAHTSEHLSDYDSDNNGVTDGIHILYCCPDGANDDETFHGKISFRQLINAAGGQPAVDFTMWASALEAIEDVNQSPADSHVYIHEIGHTFGLNDYYDYGGETDENGKAYRPAGGMVTMQHNTGSQDPYSCLLLKWAKAIVPELSCTIELKDFQSSHEAIVLSNNPYSFDSPFGEYIVIELYNPNGLNKFDSTYQWRGFYSNGPQNPGVRVYHIDSRLTKMGADGYTTDLFTDPTVEDAKLAFTNTYSGDSHTDLLGEDYFDYSEIFGIRNDVEENKYGTKHQVMLDSELFHAGDNFSVLKFGSQFPNTGRMNDGSTFGWTFMVESINSADGGYSAVINLTYVD